jgi:hypothetical protein
MIFIHLRFQLFKKKSEVFAGIRGSSLSPNKAPNSINAIKSLIHKPEKPISKAKKRREKLKKEKSFQFKKEVQLSNDMIFKSSSSYNEFVIFLMIS